MSEHGMQPAVAELTPAETDEATIGSEPAPAPSVIEAGTEAAAASPGEALEVAEVAASAAAEEPAPVVEAAVESPAAPAVEAEATAALEAGAAPAGEAGDAAVAPGAEAGTEAAAAAPAKAGKGGRKEGAARKGAKRARRPPGARSEEYVTPSAEDLAGIPSDAVRAAVEAGHPIEGKVIGWNQGGFHAVVDGITAFCPRSSMEIGAPHEPAIYLDQTFAFRVLRVEEKGHRLILSRAAILREQRRHLAEELRAKIAVGDVLEGRVIALADFGAFVDLGGVEGLVHVSELRHSRVTHPSEVVHVGQTVQAKVIKLASGGERISLSIRALEPNPWQDAGEKWASGGRFHGRVLRRTEFGWFVEVYPGVEGLLHPSQLKPGMSPDDPALLPGAEVEGWIRELDPIRKRVSLSMRETPTGNPWAGVENRYADGAEIQGTVEKIAPFGAFITLEPGLTGLLPNSEMGLPRGASVGKAYPVGKQVTLMIAHVDARRRRISLTIPGKTLEGSRADYQAYVKKARRDTGMSALAAAFERIKDQPS